MALSTLYKTLKLWRYGIGYVFVTILSLWPPCTLAEDRVQGRALNSTIREISSMPVDPAWVLVTPKEIVIGKRPNCKNLNPNVFAINPKTMAGQAALALILSAAAEGNPVDLYGSGKCNAKVKADAEELEGVVVKFR